MFTVDQINSLLDILKQQNIIFIAKNIGINYLTDDEIKTLKSIGIDPNKYYSISNDIAELSFHFGLISDAINTFDSKNVTIKDLENYFKSGKFIPLTKEDKYVLDSIKRQSLKDIKANEGRIFNDINQIISTEEKNNRVAYEKVLRDEILSGIEKKKTIKQIARELKDKTGDWGRNFEKSVHYISHLAFDEGRSSLFEKKHGEDVLVYKDVYPNACPICINAYLTGSIGSQPKIFKLSELKANGSNIGRKPNESKPVIGPHHPYCFDDKVEVYTNEGWKFFKDLNRYELFLSVNLKNGEGEWSKAVNWINQYYEGDIHYFKNKNFNLATTPNHKHVIKTKKNKQIRLVNTNKLPNESYFLKHIPKWTGKNSITIDFENHKFDTKLFCEFLGYFISEGCVVKYRNDKYRLQISQSKKKYYEDIYKVCKLLFKTVIRCEEYVQINLNKNDKDFINYLSLGKSFEKYIPNNIKELNSEYISIFLEAFCKGDGSFLKGTIWDNYKCKGSRLFYTSSKRLADDIGEMILKIGNTPSYKLREIQTIYDSKQKKFYTQNYPIYWIREVTNKYSNFSAMKHTISFYKGYIYDVELEKNHTLLVRREGKVCVSGNCRCTLQLYDPLYSWNEKDKQFNIPKRDGESHKKVNRKPIRFTFMGKEYAV